MKIAMACDHGGLRLKNVLKDDLEKNGYEVEDFGTYTEDSCDYPDLLQRQQRQLLQDRATRGLSYVEQVLV